MLKLSSTTARFAAHRRHICGGVVGIGANRSPHTTKLQRCTYANDRLRNQVDGAVARVVAYHDDVFGVTDVNRAKADVNACDATLNAAQLQRRQKQFELRKLQNRLKEIHDELDMTPRGNDRYIILVTEERSAMKSARTLSDDLDVLEDREREAFLEFSNKVRLSHEKANEYKERTKYWSITASLVGALIGMLGATLSNELRMRRMRRINAGDVAVLGTKLDRVHKELTELFHREQSETVNFIEEMKRVQRLDSPQLPTVQLASPDAENVNTCLNDLRAQSEEIARQLNELRRLTALDQALASDTNAIVYVGNDMELLLKRTEENIESKMKLQTLVAVVLGYTIFGIAAPLIYIFYTGDR